MVFPRAATLGRGAVEGGYAEPALYRLGMRVLCCWWYHFSEIVVGPNRSAHTRKEGQSHMVYAPLPRIFHALFDGIVLVGLPSLDSASSTHGSLLSS